MRGVSTSQCAAIVALCCAGILAFTGCGGGGGVAPPGERQDITAAQLQAMMNDGQPLTVADIGSADEYAVKHIPGSVCLPQADIDTWAPTLDKKMRICTVCT